jgi:predicted PurR-regulated permease PerM
MALNGAASIAVIIFVFLFGLITVTLLGVVAYSLLKMQQQVDRLTTLAEPLSNKASTTLDEVQRVTVSVGDRADTILERSEHLTDHVATKIEQTSTIIQSSVTSPLIKVSSLVNGIIAALSSYQRSSATGSKK